MVVVLNPSQSIHQNLKFFVQFLMTSFLSFLVTFFTARVSELTTAFVCISGQVPEQTERKIQPLAQQKSTPKSTQTLHSRVS